MIFGAILAGGVGSRMNIDSMPKQFLPLGSKPIFLHTLEKFLLCSEFDAIYIGVHKDWVDFVKDALLDCTPSKIPVHIACGGDDRNETIMRVIADIERDYGVRDDDFIVTHDSVRPFVKLSIIRENIAAASRYDACDTVIPATDTIVESSDGDTIEAIPLRNTMYQGQTPQSFRISVLKNMYKDLEVEQRCLLTDACKILVMKGQPVHLVQGDVTNIKLTTVMDYKVAQAMLESGVE
ncbi:MAG: 2-C-methyl-D-erythritol 4-phosphate cytidylyltransferase [Raoultibacter sp.]